MVAKITPSLSELYETDETAWLEAMAERIALGQLEGLDYEHLREHLTDMAKRDKREVERRLTILMAHLLKWNFQPDMRTGSWKRTGVVQRRELAKDASSGVLYRHASECLDRCYADAVDEVVAETGPALATLPTECPWTLERLLNDDLMGE